jgi:hypothetical protein
MAFVYFRSLKLSVSWFIPFISLLLYRSTFNSKLNCKIKKISKFSLGNQVLKLGTVKVVSRVWANVDMFNSFRGAKVRRQRLDKERKCVGSERRMSQDLKCLMEDFGGRVWLNVT